MLYYADITDDICCTLIINNKGTIIPFGMLFTYIDVPFHSFLGLLCVCISCLLWCILIITNKIVSRHWIGHILHCEDLCNRSTTLSALLHGCTFWQTADFHSLVCPPTCVAVYPLLAFLRCFPARMTHVVVYDGCQYMQISRNVTVVYLDISSLPLHPQCSL